MGINGAMKVLLLFSIFIFIQSIHLKYSIDDHTFTCSTCNCNRTLFKPRNIVFPFGQILSGISEHWTTLFSFHDHSSFVRKDFFVFMRKGELIYFCWADPDHLLYALRSSRMMHLLTCQRLVRYDENVSGSGINNNNKYANWNLYIRWPQRNLILVQVINLQVSFI